MQLSQISQICSNNSQICCPSSSSSLSSFLSHSFSLSKSLNVPIYNFFDGPPQFCLLDSMDGEIMKIDEESNNLENFEKIIIVMGHAAQILKEKRMETIGVETIQFFSPFPSAHIFETLPKSTKILCIVERIEEDRERKSGENPPEFDPLYLKVMESYFEYGMDNFPELKIISFTYDGIFSLSTADFLEINLNSDSPPHYIHFNTKNQENSSSFQILPQLLSPYVSILQSLFSPIKVFEVTHQNSSSSSLSHNFQLISIPSLEAGFGMFVAHSHNQSQFFNLISKILKNSELIEGNLQSLFENLIGDNNCLLQENFVKNLELEINNFIQQFPNSQTITNLQTILKLLEKRNFLFNSSSWLVCDTSNTDPTSVLSILESGENFNILFINSSQTGTELKNIFTILVLLFLL